MKVVDELSPLTPQPSPMGQGAVGWALGVILVTSCPFGPNAVGLQYGLHGLGWSQRLSVISRIKGAEWSAFQKFAVLPI